MSPDNHDHQGESVTWYTMDDPESLGEEMDLEEQAENRPNVTFADSLSAIQDESLAPRDLLGFDGLSRKQIHELRDVWQQLNDEKRVTLAELAVVVASESPYGDFGRFFQVLLDDPDESVRLLATSGAALSETGSLIKPLVTLAENDPSEDVREGAILALVPHVVQLDFGVGVDPQDARLLQKLKTWASTPKISASLRAASLQAYAHNTMDDDTGAIIEQFVLSDDEVLQLGAMRAMAYYGVGHLTAFLERELRSPDADRREAAAQAMAQSSDDAVIPMLTMVGREDPEPAVREAAFVSLGNLGKPAATRALEQLRSNASDDEIEIIDEALAIAYGFQALDDLEDFEMMEFDDDELSDVEDEEN